MADTRELYIKTKVEDMIVYGNICLKQFPKHERYALASEIRLCMYRILGIVIETNHKHYKKTTLTELDIEVDKLRSYLRLSANPELKYLSVDKYGNLGGNGRRNRPYGRRLDTVGKQINT